MRETYAPREKLVQRMTKDGVLLENRATGKKENISQRNARVARGVHSAKELIGHRSIGAEEEKFSGHFARSRFRTRRLPSRNGSRHDSRIIPELPNEVQIPEKNNRLLPLGLRRGTSPNLLAEAGKYTGGQVKQAVMRPLHEAARENGALDAMVKIPRILRTAKTVTQGAVNLYRQRRELLENLSLTGSAVHFSRKKIVQLAHRKISEGERDNGAVQAAFHVEKFREHLYQAGEGQRRQRKKLRRKQINAFLDKAAHAGGTVAVAALKASRKLLVLVRAGAIGFLAAILLIFASSFVSVILTTMGGETSVVTAVILSSYLAEDNDLHDTSLEMTRKEAELEKEIADIPTDPQWSHIDEFRYDLDPIGHDPYTLIAYLTVRFEDFTYSKVAGELERIFRERYTLTLAEEIEIRTRETTDEDGDPVTETYEWYILNVTLRSKTLEEVIDPWLLADPERVDWFDVLMETKGNHQFFANPFDVDWTGSISSLYGYRIDPVDGRELQIHRGMDIPMPTGTPIKAGVSGRVVSVGSDAIYGNTIILEDDKQHWIKYAHCDSVLAVQGQQVIAGETIIALVGNTGASTGSHVHIETKLKGQYVNPLFTVEWENWRKK